MNRAEISSKIIEWSHRTDLAGQVDIFIDNSTDRINTRLGTSYTLNGANSENDISIDHPNIYLYSGLREMAIWSRDAVAAAGYDNLYEEQISRLKITNNSTGFTDDTPAILSEYELEVVNAT